MGTSIEVGYLVPESNSGRTACAETVDGAAVRQIVYSLWSVETVSHTEG